MFQFLGSLQHSSVGLAVGFGLQAAHIGLGPATRLQLPCGGEPKPEPKQVRFKAAQGREHAGGIGEQFVVEVDAHLPQQPGAGDVGEFMLQAPAMGALQPLLFITLAWH